MRVLALLVRVDAALAWSRPAWAWLGQLAVVVLGVHLAADRLDDLLAERLAALAVGWPSPEAPLTVAAWSAVVAELAMIVWATWTLLRANGVRIGTLQAWWGRATLQAVLAPIAWATLAGAGVWVVAMAIEDASAPWLLDYAPPLAWTASALVTWRLVLPAGARLVLRTPERRSVLDGLLWAPLVVLVGGLAAKHGLPLWGWFS